MSTLSLNDQSHLQVLRALEANPQVSQRDLSRSLGISLGKTNYCLKALLGKGLIKVHNFRSSHNKLAYAYLLTPRGIAAKAELTARFLRAKVVEYENLREEINTLQREVGQTSHEHPSA